MLHQDDYPEALSHPFIPMKARCPSIEYKLSFGISKNESTTTTAAWRPGPLQSFGHMDSIRFRQKESILPLVISKGDTSSLPINHRISISTCDAATVVQANAVPCFSYFIRSERFPLEIAVARHDDRQHWLVMWAFRRAQRIQKQWLLGIFNRPMVSDSRQEQLLATVCFYIVATGLAKHAGNVTNKKQVRHIAHATAIVHTQNW